MSKLLRKDIVKQALRLETTERVPWVPFVGVHAAYLLGVDSETYLHSKELIVSGVENAIKLYNADGVPVVFDLQLEAEALGCRLLWAKENPPSVSSHPLSEGVDVENLLIPDEKTGRIAIVMDAARELSKRNPEICFYGLVTGPFTLALHLLGTDVFMQMFTNPQGLNKVLRFCTDVCIKMAEYYKNAGIEVIAVVDPMTSQIGPDQFIEFVTPCAIEIFSQIRSMNMLSSFFVCGNAQHNIEVMCDCKPDNISVDENIPLDYVRDICIPRGVSFGGNLKLTVTLLLGSTLDCEKDAIECLEIGGCKGFLLSPGCDLPYDTKKENLLAISNIIADKYRQDVVKTIKSELPEVELIDIESYSKGKEVKIDIITLDSSSCTPCQYMVNAVQRAVEGLKEKVIVREFKIKSDEGVKKMLQLGVSNIPTICIDGRVVFISNIPPVSEIRNAIEMRINEKS